MKVFKRLCKALYSFFLFFGICCFVVTCSFLLFFRDIQLPRQELEMASKYTFLNVVFISAGFALVDYIRRTVTVDRPVRQIRRALEKITHGDFSVELDPRGADKNFSGIMHSINCMSAELAGIEALRNDFIANVSHEMKTPLAVMQNYCTLLEDPDLPEETRQEYLREIFNGCHRLSDMMTNILRLNRLENQQIYPQKTTYNLTEQLCACLLQYESVWETSGIRLETQLQEDVVIQGDEELLNLVWSNLLSNAFKFTEPGGTVSVSLSCDDGTVRVFVQDTGCGMTPEVGNHIFEKFYQADTSHATQGNGLGLPLVKRVMDIVHGQIQVQSIEGVGTTFTVTIGT